MGQGFMTEQASWFQQLEFIKQGNHVYMDQLMPAGVEFEHVDAFLPLESMSLPAASCSQYARRPWSEEVTEAKMVFSWGSSDRRAWQIRESLQSRYAPGKKGKAPSAPSDGKPSGHSKNEKSGPPACFQIGNIRQLIAELLQVDIAQVQVFFDAYRVKRPPSVELGAITPRQSRQSDQRNSAEISPPGQSDAVLELRPSSNSLDRRTPEQLMHVLERAVMDALMGPKLPLPLSQLVSLTVTKPPRSPFRQQGFTGLSRSATSGPGRQGGAKAEQLLIELPWLKLQPPKLIVAVSESSPRISQRSDSPQNAYNPPVLDTPQEVETSSTRDNTAFHKMPYHKDNTSDTYHKPVEMTLKLALEFSAAGKAGSAQRVAFNNNLTRDLSNASGFAPHLFEVVRVSAGSIIVDTLIHPDPADRGLNPMLVATDLQKQAHQPNSLLLSGLLTSHCEGIALPKVLPGYTAYEETAYHNTHPVGHMQEIEMEGNLHGNQAQAYRSDLYESNLSQGSSETDAEERLHRQRLQLQQHHLTLHRDRPEEDYHTRPLRSNTLHPAGADQVLLRYLCWQVHFC